MGVLLFSCKRNLNLSLHYKMSDNPKKKLRLDISRKFDANVVNEDLWGQDDFTAEEFDMLESQATQSHNQDTKILNSVYPPDRRRPIHNGASTSELEDLKQEQYELEGRVKLLTLSLENASKELKEERLNRDRIVSEKVQEYQQKENVLQKEIQKIESILQFKEQEMKSVYDKIKVLESQLLERNNHIQSVLERKSPNKFLERFNFDSNKSVHTAEVIPHTSTDVHCGHLEAFQRKNKLVVGVPEGETKGTDVMSSMLYNRLRIPSNNSFVTAIAPLQQACNPAKETQTQLSAVSIARLNSEQETEELLDYYSCLLKSYLTYVQSFASKNTTPTCSTMSPISLRLKESDQKRIAVIACLRDLKCLMSYPPFVTIIERWNNEDGCVPKKEMPEVTKFASGIPISSCSLFPAQSEGTESSTTSRHPLLQLLVTLANPDTYPNCYSRNEEIEWSLAVLLSLSFSSPQKLMSSISDLPIHSLLKCHYSRASCCMTVNMLTNICSCKEFSHSLMHKNDKCIICAVAALLLQSILTSPMEFTSLMLMVEDFLSTIFTIYTFKELKLESSPCPSEVLRGVITSLWKFHEFKKAHDIKVMLILKKGFVLLHLLSRYFPDFKEKRNECENCFISLVTGILTLSKEDTEFKELYDLVHDLWDFQEDTSELDLDEIVEESGPSSEHNVMEL